MPVPNVAANAPATSSWANAVANSVAELETDLYPTTYGQLEIPWAKITGKPATYPPTLGATVASSTTFGGSPVVGSAVEAAHADHSHGTPAAPTAGSTGAVAAFTSPATAAGGKRLYVGTATPTGASEGDVWVKG